MLTKRLDAAIDGHRLLDHPFYQAWNDGTLTTDQLATYAREYGSFIAGIDAGWAQVGNEEHAEEEREHARLWSDFASELGTEIDAPSIAETKQLMDTAARLFAEPASAYGALYAFEAQQPDTSETKLVGLDTHYPMGERARRYFEVHAGDYGEAQMIVDALDDFDDAAKTRAVAACEEMSTALWDALTGVHAA